MVEMRNDCMIRKCLNKFRFACPDSDEQYQYKKIIKSKSELFREAKVQNSVKYNQKGSHPEVDEQHNFRIEVEAVLRKQKFKTL